MMCSPLSRFTTWRISVSSPNTCWRVEEVSAGVVKEKSAREDWGRAVVEKPGGRVAVMEVGRAADEGPGGADSRRIEREHMKHAELMAVITRGNVPLPPQVTITR